MFTIISCFCAFVNVDFPDIVLSVNLPFLINIKWSIHLFGAIIIILWHISNTVFNFSFHDQLMLPFRSCIPWGQEFSFFFFLFPQGLLYQRCYINRYLMKSFNFWACFLFCKTWVIISNLLTLYYIEMWLREFFFFFLVLAL